MAGARTVVLATCYFCHKGWGKCGCRWDDTPKFTSRGIVITEPNVSECGRFFVDPEACYGRSYVAWRDSLIARTESMLGHHRDSPGDAMVWWLFLATKLQSGLGDEETIDRLCAPSSEVEDL